MLINDKQSPFIQWELNPDGTRKTVEVQDEEIKIINNRAVLNWKPSKYHRVAIDNVDGINDFAEIDLDKKINVINEYKVCYENGIIFFHSDLEGFTLNIKRYFSEGQILYHVSRIYYRDANDVVKTLEEMIEGGIQAIEAYSSINNAINNAETKTTTLNTKIAEGNTTQNNLDTSIANANTKRNELNTSITNATSKKSELDTTITNANTTKLSLDQSIADGDVKNPVYAIPKTTQQSITSFDSDTKDAKVLYEIEGQSAYQRVRNGNYADGTTNWTGGASTIAVSGGNLINTCNGSHDHGTISNFFMNKPSDGTKLYARTKVKVTSSDCTKILFQIAGTVGTSTLQFINNPVTGKEYDLSGIVSSYTSLSGDKIRMYIVHYYADTATANGKVMEVMGGENGVMCIDMGTDASHPLYNKTADEMNAMFPTYFEGVGHSTVDLQTESKNLCTIASMTVDAIYTKKFTNKISTSNGTKDLTFSYTTDNLYRKGFRIYDISGNEITTGTSPEAGFSYDTGFWKTGNNSTAESSSFILHARSDIAYVEFAIGNWESSLLNVTNLQLEEGTTATPYQPYKSKALQPNITLRSVPAISDKLRNAVLVDGKLKSLECAEHVKNVSGEVILDGSGTNWAVLTSGTNVYYAYISGYSNAVQDTAGSANISDTSYVLLTAHQDVAGTKGIRFVNNSLYLYYDKTIIDAESGATLSDKINSLLSSNPLRFNYQLITPTAMPLPNQSELWSYANGRLIDNSIIKSKITYSFAQNDVAQTQGTTEALQKHEDHLETIDNEIGILKDEITNNINQETVTLSNSSPTEHITAKQNGGLDATVKGQMVVNLLGLKGQGNNVNTFIVQDSNIITQSDDWVEITYQDIGNTLVRVNADLLSDIQGFSKVLAIGTIENNTSTQAHLQFRNINGDISTVVSNGIASNTTSTVGVVMQASDFNNATNIFVRVALTTLDAVIGETVRVKEIMVVDISNETETDIDKLLDKYPYVNGAQPLLNPTVDVRGKNLWSFSQRIDQELFPDILESGSMLGYIPVKGNTNYCGKVNNYVVSGTQNRLYLVEVANIMDSRIANDFINRGFPQYSIASYPQGLNIVTAPTTKFFAICVYPRSGDGGIFENIQLEQGTTPTPYEPYKGGQIIFPTELAKIDTYQDKLTYKDGVAKVDREVKHVVLDGSLDYDFFADSNAGKAIRISNFDNIFTPFIDFSETVLDHFSNLLNSVNTISAADINHSILRNFDNSLFITISDIYSGWGETYTPLSEEMKAYMNGWQMNNGTFGTPYNNSGTKTWIPLGDTDNARAVTTVPTTVSPTIEDGTIKHYELYYALAEPETEEIQPIILGDGVNLVEGQNTVSVKSGVVYERAEPVLDVGTNNYIFSLLSAPTSYLSYPVKRVKDIYKYQDNIITLDTSNWTLREGHEAYYGGGGAFIPQAVYESSERVGSQYFALCETVAENSNCQVQEVDISYEDNIRGAVNELVESTANNEQSISNLWTTLLPMADKEQAVTNIDALESDATLTDVISKINEVLNTVKQ